MIYVLGRKAFLMLEGLIIGITMEIIQRILFNLGDWYNRNFWSIATVIFLVIAVVIWLELSGRNFKIRNHFKSRIAAQDIFEGNNELTIKEFAKNFSNCVTKQQGFSYEDVLDKLKKTCTHLMLIRDGNFIPLTIDEHFRIMWEQQNEEDKIWISKDGFIKWLEEASIRLPDRW